MDFSAQIWAGIASALAAWVALILSIINVSTSRRAMRIAEQQETRRKPSIVCYLQDGYVAVGAKPDARVYAILISLSNTSDSNNALAQATLRLTYAKQDGTKFTARIGAEGELPSAFLDKASNYLRLPVRVDAHQTVSGWCFFSVHDAILENAHINRTEVTFADTHGNQTSVEVLNAREYRNDIQTPPNKENL